MALIKKTINFGDHTLKFETGVIARQADGAVVVDLDGTTVLVTAVGVNNPDTVNTFFPLRVDYQEKFYASGKIPGGFFKREGRPTEKETLTARLIDRPIRPSFPKGFAEEVQIIANVVSVNPEVEPDIPALIGASAAISISGMPFNGPIGAARVGYINGEFVLNPTQKQLEKSNLNLVVAGNKTSVLMVESEANELSEKTMLEAVMFGHNGYQSVIEAIEELAADVAKPKWDWQAKEEEHALVKDIKENYSSLIGDAYLIKDKLERKTKLKEIKAKILEKYLDENLEIKYESYIVEEIISSLESEIVRTRILKGEPRIDGRDTKTVRPINVETSLLERTHGSALFTRGETQAMVVATLGSKKDAQIVDSILGETKENFMLHYNFPPYCVGEIGMVGSPKRREIGHGKLAKRAIAAVIPDESKFPYVLRVVSEITESNGSSSMASVCGTSLALMDAGVPIKAPVAGIAMGLIKEDEKFSVLSDILGDEDHLGDMDFKVAGTENGVTALQMDIKIDGITEEIMEVALAQAKEGRIHILGIMNTALSQPKENVSDFAPRIISFKINPEKIKDVIGKGGATIRSLTENTDASIDLQEDGTVQVATSNKETADMICKKINELTAEVEVGKIYEGKVVRIADFGAFVNILPGKDGLLHISQISKKRIEKVSDEVSEGQVVKVKVTEIDRQGRVKLSMKDISETEIA